MKRYSILLVLVIVYNTMAAQTVEKWKLADLQAAIAKADSSVSVDLQAYCRV